MVFFVEAQRSLSIADKSEVVFHLIPSWHMTPLLINMGFVTNTSKGTASRRLLFPWLVCKEGRQCGDTRNWAPLPYCLYLSAFPILGQAIPHGSFLRLRSDIRCVVLVGDMKAGHARPEFMTLICRLTLS